MLAGAYFKQLRQAKMVTLAELAEDTGLNQGFISRFERDLANISVTNFAALLQGLNISIEEFTLGQRESQLQTTVPPAEQGLARFRSQVPFMADFFQTDQLTSAEATKPFLERAEARYRRKPTRKNHFVWLFYRVIMTTLTQPVDQAALQQDSLPVVQYLQQVDNWGQYECYLFEAFTPALADETMMRLLRIGLKRSKQLEYSATFAGLGYELLVAVLTSLLARQAHTAAHQVLQMMQKKTELTADQVIMTNFFAGWVALAAGDQSTGEDQCRQAIATYTQLGLLAKAAELDHTLQQLLADPQTIMIIMHYG